MRRGLFITLEGPEGSGKSSQARWLAQALRARGARVVTIQDPGSTALGRSLRRVLLHSRSALSPLTEALLFIGGRVQLVEERIRPAMARGLTVVCDRFHDSTVAYQGFGGGVDAAWLDRLGRSAIHRLTPDLTVLLDLPTEQGFSRLHRSRDRMERKTLAFHRRVRVGFLRLAAREPRRIVVVNASRPVQDVRRDIDTIIRKRLGPST